MANLNVVSILGRLVEEFQLEDNDNVEVVASKIAYDELGANGKKNWTNFVPAKFVTKKGSDPFDNIPRGLKKGTLASFQGIFHIVGTKDEAPTVEFRIVSCRVISQPKPVQEEPGYLREGPDHDEDGVVDNNTF